LLSIGWRLRDKRPAYAQAMQGGAVAVLYLTLFAAFRIFDIIAVGPVFACMVAVAALAAALAVMQNARALAVIGALGGFATPLLVSTGAGNHVALFSYYLVLDLGIAAVAWHRHWRLLNLIGFFATFLVGAAWGALRYGSEHYASAQAFLIAFFLVFAAILLLPARQRLASRRGETRAPPPAPRSDAWINGTLLFGLPTIAFALQHGMVRGFDYGTAISALLLALFYVGIALWMRSRAELATLFEASLAIATVFLTLVIPFALDAHATSGAWALEGAGLVWLGWRQQRLMARAFGYALLLLAGIATLHAVQRPGGSDAFIAALLFNGALVGAASLASAYFARRFGPGRGESGSRSDTVFSARFGELGASDTTQAAELAAAPAQPWAPATAEDAAEPLLIGWGTFWVLFTAARQIDLFVSSGFELAATLACVTGLGLLFTELSQRLAWPRIALPVLGLAPVWALGVAYSALTQDAPSQHGGWWAWPFALAAHLFVLWRAAPRWPQPGTAATHALGLLVFAALGALQGRAITRDWGDPASAWAWLGWLLVPALLLMLLPHDRLAARWPVRAAPAAYRTHAGAVLAAGLLLWSVLANLASNGAARPLPHVPLLNPLDLGVGVALLGAWLWMRSPAAQPVLAQRPHLPLQLSAASGFIWLNAILIRAFHHYGGVPFRFSAWVDSLAVQSGISLLWSATALALMWSAARRAQRTPWVVGAVLLGAVVLKLVLVDLSGSGTIARIVSFIGVGVLMLIIGYVAPLPDSTVKETGNARA
jgi:uncharacterized membrane protein